MFVEENSASILFIYRVGMRDRIMRSGTKFAREIQLTDWSTTLEYKYRVIFVLVLGVICTLRGAVG